MAGPRLSNADSAPYWEAAAQGRLVLQRCSQCGHTQFPPRYMCAQCWAERPEWIESAGVGVVESFTVVHRAPTPAFKDMVPYVVATVIVAEGPRLMSNIIGASALETEIGDTVTATVRADSQGRALLQFQRAEEAA